MSLKNHALNISKFRPCDWYMIYGWEKRAKIISNWSRHPLGGVQKPSLKTQDAIKSLSSSFFCFAFCHRVLTLFSSALWACSGLHASCYLTPRWEEKPPSLVTSFYSFTLVSFLSIEFRVQKLSLLQCPAPTAPASNFNQTTTPQLQPTPKTSLWRTTELSANQQPRETPFLLWQRESLNTKARQVKQLQNLTELVHLI